MGDDMKFRMGVLERLFDLILQPVLNKCKEQFFFGTSMNINVRKEKGFLVNTVGQ